jgi:hypothetical protein
MPGHFGIRITDADKDKLVGELDVDDRHLNNSTTAVMFMAVRWRRSPTISAEHWPGSTSHLGFAQPRSSRRRISFAPARRGGLPALLYRSMWGGARSCYKPQYTAPTGSLPQ